jgi:hypothetical protein
MKYKIINISHTENSGKRGETRKDGRYPLRIGRIVDLDFQQIRVGEPMNLNYLLDADGSDYSKKHLTTSSVTNLNRLERKLIIETANSIFEFEKIED